MRVKINDQFYELTEQELQFVRDTIGEWENTEGVFERPMLIPVSEIAKSRGVQRQAVLKYCKKHNIELYKIGGSSYLTFDDALNNWFKVLA